MIIDESNLAASIISALPSLNRSPTRSSANRRKNLMDYQRSHSDILCNSSGFSSTASNVMTTKNYNKMQKSNLTLTLGVPVSGSGTSSAAVVTATVANTAITHHRSSTGSAAIVALLVSITLLCTVLLQLQFRLDSFVAEAPLSLDEQQPHHDSSPFLHLQRQLKTTLFHRAAATVGKASRSAFSANKEEKVSEKQSPDPIPIDAAPLKVPPNLTKDDTFAACLLIKDDNHWLIEWLAYNYHVMPLRHLIVAVDPTSRTSPKRILQRWNYLMNIQVWHDVDYMASQTNKKKKHPRHIKYQRKNATLSMTPRSKNKNGALEQHRQRQNEFFVRCLESFQEQHVSAEWVQLVDTDEYITVHDDNTVNTDSDNYIEEPGSVLRALRQHEQGLRQQQDTTQKDCWYIPRFMYGAKESSPRVVERYVPPHPTSNKNQLPISGRSLLTQRYLYRNSNHRLNGKNIVRLSALKQQRDSSFESVHRISHLCPAPASIQYIEQLHQSPFLRIHHYLGTKEQYFSRSNDPRAGDNRTTYQQVPTEAHPVEGAYFKRDIFRYDQITKEGTVWDSSLRGWIDGFCKSVGYDMAQYLLEGVGQVEYM